ncbi:MAG: toll/interleukin-1 receptor domain-containing protein, partial [Prevotellaceae bacterium]|nr:toll/interleukin-1 receptor domain-containing protein [Candidatus Colivivens equi]
YKTEYDDIIKSNISRIHLKENVKELLLLFNPKIIITTLPINVIELDLGYDLTSSIYYYKDGVQSTIQEELYSSTVLDFIGKKKNLVYHIFGPAKGAIQTGGWVKNEMDLLEYLHTLHTRTPDGLVKYIQATKAHLLVLGCCLPDWFFRFLLYPMNPSGGCLINPHDYGESLNYYLSAKGFDQSLDVDDILNELIDKISNERMFDDVYDVFLSIASEDLDSAVDLKKMLEKEFNIKIWLFSQENIAGNWETKIEKALNSSKYFMPYVTRHYINKFIGKQRTRCDNPEISGLETCTVKYAIPRIDDELAKGNSEYVLPILKEGEVYKYTSRTKGTIEKIVDEKYIQSLVDGQNDLFPDFFDKLQLHKYNTGTGDTLKDRLDERAYSTLSSIFKNNAYE